MNMADRICLSTKSFRLAGRAGGSVKIEINQRYLLSEAAQAHSDLEARKTTGSTVMIPE